MKLAPAQDESSLAARYLDGSIDALDLLLSSDTCINDKPLQQESQHHYQCTDKLSPTVQGSGTESLHHNVGMQHLCSSASGPQSRGSHIHGDAASCRGKAESCETSADHTGQSREGQAAAPNLDTQPCAGCSAVVRAGIPRRHAGELSCDDFVLQHMAPNLPVMIQASRLLHPLSFSYCTPLCRRLRVKLFPATW